MGTVSEIISLHTGQPQRKNSVEQWIGIGMALIAEKEDGTKVVVSAPLVTKTKLASNESLIVLNETLPKLASRTGI